MGLLRSFAARCALAAGLCFLLPLSASATTAGAILTTTGVNTFAVTLRLECSGILCGFAGLGSPYQQTQTSTLTGSTGLWTDDAADTLRFSSDAAGTTNLLTMMGSNVTFTGLSALLTGGGTSVTVSNLVAGALNAGLASILGLNLASPPQSIAFAMSGANALTIGASGTTNAPNIPALVLAPVAVNTLGTLGFSNPDLDGFPDFVIQNLRGTFQSLTTTATLGVTVRITLRATFTMNFAGESFTNAIPEPASLAMVGLGLVGFAMAAKRRRA